MLPIQNFEAVNKLQITRATNWSGLTESNNLANALMTYPDITDVLSNAAGGKFFTSFLLQGQDAADSYTYVNNSEYEWSVTGDLNRSVQIVDNPTPIAADRPGIAFSEFTLALDNNWLDNDDMVRTECTGLIIKVVKEPVQAGAKYIYTFQIDTDDPNDFLAPADVISGAGLGYIGNAHPEKSKRGSSKFTSPYKFRNQLGIQRWSHEVTGSANSDVLLFTGMGRNDKGQAVKSTMWMYQAQWQSMQLWMGIQERMRWYSVYNKTSTGLIPLKGSNGRPVRVGAGIFDQISPHNTTTYGVLTENLLQDFTTHLQINSPDIEGSHIVVSTGTGGLREFHRAFKDQLRLDAAVTTPIFTTLVKGKEAELEYGKYFRTFRNVLGTTITLHYNPMFDDRKTFTRIHPESGLPYESYNMTFLNMGKIDGKRNIRIVAKSGNGFNRKLLSWWEGGSSAPTPDGLPTADTLNFFMNNGKMRSNGEDGHTIHFLSETGVQVLMPELCGRLIKV